MTEAKHINSRKSVSLKESGTDFWVQSEVNIAPHSTNKDKYMVVAHRIGYCPHADAPFSTEIYLNYSNANDLRAFAKLFTEATDAVEVNVKKAEAFLEFEKAAN